MTVAFLTLCLATASVNVVLRPPQPYSGRLTRLWAIYLLAAGVALLIEAS